MSKAHVKIEISPSGGKILYIKEFPSYKSSIKPRSLDKDLLKVMVDECINDPNSKFHNPFI